ncbi:hypothetical protein IRJ41_007728 [Triplophysa rosa]|uniref:Immunoglobulin domain-containing protein n=1 Tax=Triplophysa rosa TaxID=992332 RepID=A0A9W7T4Q7_TRIRA|nr:hypothetical protein IRJ41_007728 [Triplophysa rosa]
MVPVIAYEGESVTLNTESEIQRDSEIKWISEDKTILVTGKNGVVRETKCTDDERFRDRLKMNHQTGDLTITDTRQTDAGLYTLQINSDGKISNRIFCVYVRDKELLELCGSGAVKRGAARTGHNTEGLGLPPRWGAPHRRLRVLRLLIILDIGSPVTQRRVAEHRRVEGESGCDKRPEREKTFRKVFSNSLGSSHEGRIGFPAAADGVVVSSSMSRRGPGLLGSRRCTGSRRPEGGRVAAGEDIRDSSVCSLTVEPDSITKQPPLARWVHRESGLSQSYSPVQGSARGVSPGPQVWTSPDPGPARSPCSPESEVGEAAEFLHKRWVGLTLVELSPRIGLQEGHSMERGDSLVRSRMHTNGRPPNQIKKNSDTGDGTELNKRRSDLSVNLVNVNSDSQYR